jgi:hypothetical protein
VPESATVPLDRNILQEDAMDPDFEAFFNEIEARTMLHHTFITLFRKETLFYRQVMKVYRMACLREQNNLLKRCYDAAILMDEALPDLNKSLSARFLTCEEFFAIIFMAFLVVRSYYYHGSEVDANAHRHSTQI